MKTYKQNGWDVPEGFVIVPVEPTPEMKDAAMEVLLHRGNIYEDHNGNIVVESITPRYLMEALIAAAPQPSAKPEAVGKPDAQAIRDAALEEAQQAAQIAVDTLRNNGRETEAFFAECCVDAIKRIMR